MKLVISRRTLGISLVVVIVLISLIVFLVLRTRSKYVWPEPSTPPGTVNANAYNTYVSDINTCNTNYSAAIINDPASTSTAQQTKTTCLSDATTKYLKARCPAVDPTKIGTADVQALPNYTTAYNTFTTQVNRIRAAFLTLVTTPPSVGGNADQFPVQPSASTVDTSEDAAGIGSLTYSQYLVKKARDAAIAGATRRYIATVCPDYYKTGDGSAGAATAPVDYTAAYQTWDYNTTTGYQVSATDFIAWVKRAGFKNASGTEVPLYKYSSGSNPIFNRTGATDINGVNTYKVWEVAKYNGPGSTTTVTYPAGA